MTIRLSLCLFVCTCVGIYMCVCLCLFVCLSVSRQNSSRTDTLIWTQFSLNTCLLHWLAPYWNRCPLVKVQGHMNSDAISFSLLHNSQIPSLLWISVLLYPIKMKCCMYMTYALSRFAFEFHKKIKWVMSSLWHHLIFL